MNYSKSFFQKGVSIIEVIIVIAITGCIVFAVVNLPFAIGLVGASRDESLASQITAEKVEDLRFVGYDNLANGTTAVVDFRLSKLPQGAGQYVIEDCPPTICTTGELVKKATVTVTWKKSGKNLKSEVSTFISKGGIR